MGRGDDAGGDEFPWMSYAEARRHEAEAAALGVSAKARSSKGFMREYGRAGSARAMRSRPLPPGEVGGSTWGQKRRNFIRRHLAQYGTPTRRRTLAFYMWAFDPASIGRRGKK
jgi:hypothetical protein